MGIEAGSSIYYQAKRGIVQDGLVLHLDAGVKESYPGFGNTWYDLSGNGNNGVLVNGVGYDSGNGGCMVFDGIDDYVNGSIFINTDWTISILYLSKVINTRPVYYPISIQPYMGLGFGGTFSSTTLNKWYFFTNTSSTMNSNTYTISINNWYNLTVSKSNNIYTLYSNGLFTASYTDVSRDIINYRIGRRFDNDAWHANGNVSSVYIHNKALSADEVRRNFNATRGRYGI